MKRKVYFKVKLNCLWLCKQYSKLQKYEKYLIYNLITVLFVTYFFLFKNINNKIEQYYSLVVDSIKCSREF